MLKLNKLTINFFKELLWFPQSLGVGGIWIRLENQPIQTCTIFWLICIFSKFLCHVRSPFEWCWFIKFGGNLHWISREKFLRIVSRLILNSENTRFTIVLILYNLLNLLFENCSLQDPSVQISTEIEIIQIQTKMTLWNCQ